MRTFILIFVSILCNSVVLAAPAPPSPEPFSDVLWDPIRDPWSPPPPPPPTRPPSFDDTGGQHHIASPSTRFSGPVLDGNRIKCPDPSCPVIAEMNQGMPKHIKAKHPKALRLYYSHKHFDTWKQCPYCPFKAQDGYRGLDRHIKRAQSESGRPSSSAHVLNHAGHIAGPSTRSSAHGDRMKCPVSGCPLIATDQGMALHLRARHPEALEQFYAHKRFSTLRKCPHCPFRTKMDNDGMNRHIKKAHPELGALDPENQINPRNRGRPQVVKAPRKKNKSHP